MRAESVSLVEIVSLASLIFWILLSLDRKRSWPSELVLPDPTVAERYDPEVRLVAIVPARDEAEILPETLPSLLRQEIPAMRVVLVDDSSSDGTALVARRLAEESDLGHRLEIVTASRPPAGWSGKVHALSCGYETALNHAAGPPDWLLLTDADIYHRPGSVRSLLHQAGAAPRRRSYDLVSVMARLRAETAWERLVIPAFVFFFQLLYPFRRVADPRSRVAAAAGGCLLVRRSALDDAGGLAQIGEEIIDDVALARAIKGSGGSIWLGLDRGIASKRPYPALRDLWRMVSRTAFDQLGYRWSLLVLTLAALGAFVISPPVSVGVRILSFWASGSVDEAAARILVWALLAWILSAVAFQPAVRHHGLSRLHALTLPLAGVLFALMTASSAINTGTGGGPSWRGRDYPASRRSG